MSKNNMYNFNEKIKELFNNMLHKRTFKRNIIGVSSVIFVGFMISSFIFFPMDSEGNNRKHTQDEKVEKKANDKKDESQKKKKTESLPDIKADDWKLVLVNATHAIDHENEQLEVMPNGFELDERITKEYLEMEKAAAADGINLKVVSSYRSIAQQEEVFATNLNQHIAEGDTPEVAESKTRAYITEPGTSEHHTGLAIDVVEQSWFDQGLGLEESFYDTEAGKWLEKNVPNYGFVIRYPKGKEEITNINYEPWHLRYVGKESAKYMTKNKLVLEEYLKKLEKAEKPKVKEKKAE